jgi:hypothetical protein
MEYTDTLFRQNAEFQYITVTAELYRGNTNLQIIHQPIQTWSQNI